MRLAPAYSAFAVFVMAAAHSANVPHGGQLRTTRVRCYGGREATAFVRADALCLASWEASVESAPVCRGTLEIDAIEGRLLVVPTPVVQRRARMSIRVDMDGHAGVLHTRLDVYPEFDARSMRELTERTSLGVCELDTEVSARLARLGCRFTRTPTRHALEFFDGDALLASGTWWSARAEEMRPQLDAQLAAGARLVVVEGPIRGAYFASEEAGGVPSVPDPQIVDHESWLADSALFEGWELSRPLVLRSGAISHRRIAVGAASDRAVAVSLYPPCGGAVLAVSLRLLSQLDTDPAAALLLERCMRWAADPSALPGESASARTVKDDALRGMFAKWGFGREAELPGAADGVVVSAGQAPSEELRPWIESGGVAVVLVRGAPDEAPTKIERTNISRGLSVRLLSELCVARDTEGDDDWRELKRGGEYRELVGGFIAVEHRGKGKVCLARCGRLGRDFDDTWQEFLIQVFTNLGVRIGDAPRLGLRPRSGSSARTEVTCGQLRKKSASVTSVM